jgi:transcription elongation GreA/GreB family factor
VPAPRSRSKTDLKRELLEQLEAQLVTARAAHAAATEGAISDESRPENDKDTRGLEQSYLARGHAQRVADLETAVATIAALPTGAMTRVSVGALVTIEEGDRTRELYVAGYGGGLTLAGDITVITPTAPMGRVLLGKQVDDECELAAGGAQRTLVIAQIA